MRHRSAARAAMLACAGAFAVFLAPAAFGADAVTPERYRRDLAEASRLFREEPDPASAAAVARRLAWLDVQWEGRLVTVRDPWLTDAVATLERIAPAQREAQRERIADHLAARSAAVEAELDAADDTTPAGGTPATRPEDPEALLEGILEQQQYQPPAEDPRLARAAAEVRERIRSAWRGVRDFVRDFFQPREQSGFWGTIRRLVTLVLAAAGVLALGWFVVRTILRAAVDSAVADPELDMPEEPPRPAEMQAEAQRLASGGDLRGAVRALYLALLGRLHEQGVIAYDRHRTNREYLRTMQAGARRKAAFGAVVEVFDRKWYGREACAPEELARFEADARNAGDPSFGRAGDPAAAGRAGPAGGAESPWRPAP